MKKKSQVTVYIIIGLILILSTTLAIYLTKEPNTENLEKIEVNLFKTYATSCLEKASNEAITIFLWGGHINKTDIEKIDKLDLAYGFMGSENKIPTKEEAEEDFNVFISEQLYNCMKNSSFEGYSLKYTAPIVKTDLTQNAVIFSAYFPLTITKGLSQVKLSDFTYSKQGRILYLIDSSSKISDSILKRGEINYDFLGNFSVKVYIMQDKNDMLIALQDDKYGLVGNTTLFVFGGKLN